MSLINIESLINYPPKEVVDFLDHLNKEIIAHYHDCRYGFTYKFPEPYLTSEEKKKEVVRELKGAGYEVKINSERISLSEVILSLEISWQEWFNVNHKRVRTFFLLGAAVHEEKAWKQECFERGSCSDDFRESGPHRPLRDK